MFYSLNRFNITGCFRTNSCTWTNTRHVITILAEDSVTVVELKSEVRASTLNLNLAQINFQKKKEDFPSFHLNFLKTFIYIVQCESDLV